VATTCAKGGVWRIPFAWWKRTPSTHAMNSASGARNILRSRLDSGMLWLRVCLPTTLKAGSIYEGRVRFDGQY
jgi:hypothetical protein